MRKRRRLTSHREAGSRTAEPIDLDLSKLFFTICLLILLAFSLTSCVSVRQPPIAIADASPTAGEAPLLVYFNGLQSSDPDGTIVSYQWDFDGNGTIDATGATQTHSYEASGLFKAILTVTDNSGLIDKDTVFIDTRRASIYFASDRSGNYEIYRMDTDGSNQARVTNDPNFDLWPALLPNTRALLAFTSDRDTPGTFDIFKANADGTLATNLTSSQPASNEIQPTWASDGSKIAFASDQSAIFEIFIMSADGIVLVPTPFVNQTPSHAIAPAWSPLGNEIAFVRYNPAGAGDTDLLKANATTGAVSNLLVDPTFDDGGVGGPVFVGLALGSSRISWSPDGSLIVFSSSRNIAGTGGTDIYVITASGGTPVNINTAFATPPYSSTFPVALSVNTPANEFDPFWLPNGKEIAFVREIAPGVFQLFKVNIQTGAITQLTAIGDNIMPACEPLCPR